jgi:hypothetical protein
VSINVSTSTGDEFDEFTKWKAALDDAALRSLFDKYIYDEPRTTDATTNATKTVTAASASLSSSGAYQSNQLLPAGTSVREQTWNDGKDHEYIGVNKSPSRPVQINDHNSIELAPYSNDKAVKMNLNGNDVLWVDSSDTTQVEIMFRRGNGAQVKLNIRRIVEEIEFEYTSEFGKTYKVTKPAGDFQIANLVHGSDGELRESYFGYGENFAIYSSTDAQQGASLSIPSL